MGQMQVRGAEFLGYVGSKEASAKGTKETGDVFKNFLKDRSEGKEQIKPDKDGEKTEESVKPDQVGKKAEESVKSDKETSEEQILGMQLAQLMYGLQSPELPMEEDLAPEMEVLMEGVSVETLPEDMAVSKESTAIFLEPGTDVPAEDAVEGKVLVADSLEKGKDVASELVVKESVSEETVPVTEKKDSLPKEDTVEKEQTGENQMGHLGAQVQENAPVTRSVFAEKTESVHTERMNVTNPEEILEKLPENIVEKISTGVREFEIQIAPEHLGKIAIKVLYERGNTMISIACSEQKTMDMLAKNARELGAVMERNLGEETTVVVEKKEMDYLHQNDKGHGDDRRQSEQERQREEQRKHSTDTSGQFLQRLRLGLEV